MSITRGGSGGSGVGTPIASFPVSAHRSACGLPGRLSTGGGGDCPDRTGQHGSAEVRGARRRMVRSLYDCYTLTALQLACYVSDLGTS